MQREALAVPASNLAVMHTTLGQGEKARHYEAIAERIEATAGTQRR